MRLDGLTSSALVLGWSGRLHRGVGFALSFDVVRYKQFKKSAVSDASFRQLQLMTHNSQWSRHGEGIFFTLVVHSHWHQQYSDKANGIRSWAWWSHKIRDPREGTKINLNKIFRYYNPWALVFQSERVACMFLLCSGCCYAVLRWSHGRPSWTCIRVPEFNISNWLTVRATALHSRTTSTFSFSEDIGCGNLVLFLFRSCNAHFLFIHT